MKYLKIVDQIQHLNKLKGHNIPVIQSYHTSSNTYIML